MYRFRLNGYTINRRNHRQQEIQKIDSEILHIEFLSKKINFHRHRNFYALHKSLRLSVFLLTSLVLLL